jgi:hypothetical protein
MHILLARESINEEPKSIDYDAIKEKIAQTGLKIFYFDRDNSHEDMLKLVKELSGEGYSVHFNEVKYGLLDDEYMYEVHVI